MVVGYLVKPKDYKKQIKQKNLDKKVGFSPMSIYFTIRDSVHLMMFYQNI